MKLVRGVENALKKMEYCAIFKNNIFTLRSRDFNLQYNYILVLQLLYIHLYSYRDKTGENVVILTILIIMT